MVLKQWFRGEKKNLICPNPICYQVIEAYISIHYLKWVFCLPLLGEPLKFPYRTLQQRDQK